MMEKLKCPHCGKCIGETVENEHADITMQMKKPLKTQKTKAVIEKICHKCKEHYYMIFSDQAMIVT